MVNRLIVDLIKVSLSTSVIVALLLLFTPLLRKRYPAKWRYFAWLVVAIRLLIPVVFTFPEAPVIIAIPQAAIAEAAYPQPNDGQQVINGTRQEYMADTQTEDGIVSDQGGSSPTSANPPAISPAQLAIVIWLAGVAVFFSIQTAVYIRFLRKVHYSPQGELSASVWEQWWDISKEMGVARLPTIVVCSGVSAPILTGLVRPRLLLPHNRYTHEEMSFILRHELVHYRRRDLMYKLVLMIASGIHWFNPLIYLMTVQAGKDVEMSCDDEVILNLSDDARASYGNTILAALPKKWRMEPVLTTSFGSTKKTMKQRLRNLFDHRLKRRGIATFCAVIGLAAALCGTIDFTSVSAADQGNAKPSQTMQAFAGSIRFSNNDGGSVKFGSYSLSKQQRYSIVVNWDEGGKRPLYCIEETSDGKESDERTEYEITSGTPLSITVPKDGTYRFVIPQGAQMTNIVCTVDIVVKEDSGAAMKTAKIGNETWYLVETETQLRSIATDTSTLSRKYMQNADIHMTSVWTPIGDEYHPFTGIYNGNGFAISGLRYQENGSKYQGLFGYAEDAEMTGITIVGLGTGPIVNISIGGKGAHDNMILNQDAYQGNVADRNKQTVSYDAVEIRKYDDGDPYIHDMITNNTNRKIVSYERGMLAYDKNGQPLKLEWNGWDSSSAPSYYFLYDWGSEDIPAGQTKNLFGGWSLFSDWNAVQNPSQETQPYKDIAYVLYNFKQITFEDGTVWKNPDYDNWLKTYEGKQADLNSLNGYYPYSCIIE